ncbi:TIGR01459 family HAD-type hydrolase [Cognatishimia sp. MH4019]|uniref:TIGR01459 family HAD-type hydrolase n=1 Tax=Cognatishimia sp. MH4019 TaxID=2854030 RepID=UPI001CD72D74|nr:TIGR01459 family HAD-type hydrolase [Cognatishimia sp. MH4019]
MQTLDSILTVADRYDAIVFDQWGVLHNGSAPYPHAVGAVEALAHAGVMLGVLSNSGKSAAINRDRITGIGFPASAFGPVMTSGEALKIDMRAGLLAHIRALYVISATPEDAARSVADMGVAQVATLSDADAVLLMGLPDGGDHATERAVLREARAQGKRLICSNPDRHSPRADGVLVESPGALAHEYADEGGEVLFYGKPHRPIFDALGAQLGARRVLMVGDSPEHDIAGAKAAGWDSLFIQGGLYADVEPRADLFDGIGLPDYMLPTLR